MNVLQMFRMGNDYVQIAKLLGITEAEVEKEIHRLRDIERSGCVPVEHYVKPEYPKARIPYAGKERLMPTELGR